MTRGRKPKPFVIKQLEGNPGKRKLILPAIQEQPSPCPSCPAWLDTTAKAEWRRLATSLHDLGLLTPMSSRLFAAYCDSFSAWHRAAKVLEKEGETFTTDKGYVGPHPAVAQRHRAKVLMLKYAVEFGMSPSSRQRIGLPKAKEEDQAGSTLNGNWKTECGA